MIKLSPIILLLLIITPYALAANITDIQTPQPRPSDATIRQQEQQQAFEIMSRLDSIEKKIELNRQVSPGTEFQALFEEQDKITQEKLDKLQTSMIIIFILIETLQFAFLGLLRARGYL